MSTYGTMIDRIASELARSDLTTQIKAAILSAIKHYERQRFYFTEFTDSLSASSSQEFYSVSDFADMSNLVNIDSLTIDIGNSTYPLVERSWAYMEQVQTRAGYTGDPTDYVYYAQRLRLYPIPSQARTLHISGVRKFATLSATTDTNAWMTDGEALIRSKAKEQLYLHVIHKPEKAAVMGVELERLEQALNRETEGLVSMKTRPTQF